MRRPCNSNRDVNDNSHIMPEAAFANTKFPVSAVPRMSMDMLPGAKESWVIGNCNLNNVYNGNFVNIEIGLEAMLLII